MKRLILSALISLAVVVPAFADQAAWVSREEAARALAILAKHEKILHYCAPCGDKEVTEEVVKSIGMAVANDGSLYEILVNGKGVDLAYVYFAKKNNKWVNVALEAKIDVNDVPKQLSDALLQTITKK